jgi:hypothetical protein
VPVLDAQKVIDAYRQRVALQVGTALEQAMFEAALLEVENQSLKEQAGE